MRTATGPLIAFLNSAAGREFAIADLYTFTTVSGALVGRYTSWDQNLVVGGNTFKACGSLNSQGGYQPIISRSQSDSRIGFETSTVEINIEANALATLLGVPFIQAFQSGLMDGAQVLIQRLIMPAPGIIDPTFGTLTDFNGEIGDITSLGRTGLKVQCNNQNTLMDVNVPRAVYSPGCRHSLYDAGCALNRASFVQTGLVTSGSDFININTNLSTSYDPISAPASAPTLGQTAGPTGVNLSQRKLWATVTYLSANGETIASAESVLTVSQNNLLTVASPAAVTGATGWNCYVGGAPGAEQLQNNSPIAIGTGFTEPITGEQSGVPSPVTSTSNFFALGVVTFTSGANNGLSRTIASSASGTLVLVLRLPVAPAIGDSFSVVPGCDKSMNSCINKFNNLVHFGGFPFIPNPEAVL